MRLHQLLKSELNGNWARSLFGLNSRRARHYESCKRQIGLEANATQVVVVRAVCGWSTTTRCNLRPLAS